jgi:hypothetical protein
MFLGSALGRFPVPACGFALRRAQRRSRLAEGHRRRQREAVCVLDMPSTHDAARRASARWPAAIIDTGGEFRRRRGATLIRAMTFACNDGSRQSQLRVFSIFLPSATGKYSRIAPRNSSL